MSKAMEIGAWAAETDVRHTSDNVLVISHDNTFGGLTISSSTYEQLYNAGTLSNGEHLPKLEDFLQLLLDNPTNKTIFRLEIKDSDYTATKAAEMVLNKDLADRIIWVSFSASQGDAIVAEYRSFYNDSSKSAPFCLNCTSTPDYSGFLTRGWIGFTSSAYDAAGFDKATKAGLWIDYWTVNTEDALKNALQLNISSISTDYPNMMMTLIESLK